MEISKLANQKLIQAAGSGSIAAVRREANRSLADWILILDEADGKPAGLLHTADLDKYSPSDILASLIPALPALITMDGEADERQAVSHPVIDVLTEDMPGILIMKGDTPIGVWEDKAIADSIAKYGAQERLMYDGDSQLPGIIKIAKIVRFCRFQQNAVDCRTRLEFNEKADEMPDCPNDKRLNAHKFIW
jgi:hypothetical protein